MLIQFTTKNFRSIAEEQTLNLTAAGLSELKEEAVINTQKNLPLLKCAAIYGANASGKSNLIMAMRFARYFILESAREGQKGDAIDVTPFLLSTETTDQPSYFEFSFLIDNVKYRYGFGVNAEVVVEEYLYEAPKQKEYLLFEREYQSITVDKRFKEGKGLNDKARANALFISVVAQFNGAVAGKVLDWFKTVKIISGMLDSIYEGFTVRRALEDETFKAQLTRLLCESDLGISGLAIETIPITHEYLPHSFSDELKRKLIELSKDENGYRINLKREKFDASGAITESIALDFEDAESEGTKKLFRLAGPMLDSLYKGHAVVIDEMDARLHPKLTKALIELFNSMENKTGAQLIFTTHDTNLLNLALLRRDQIWFTEKNKMQSTQLYSLYEFTNARKDASIEKDYLKGKYGAIPYLGDFRHLLNDPEHAQQ